MIGLTVAATASVLLAVQPQARQIVERASDSPVVAEVLAVRKRLGAAALTGDVDTLKGLLSAQLVVNDPGNKVRRTCWHSFSSAWWPILQYRRP